MSIQSFSIDSSQACGHSGKLGFLHESCDQKVTSCWKCFKAALEIAQPRCKSCKKKLTLQDSWTVTNHNDEKIGSIRLNPQMVSTAIIPGMYKAFYNPLTTSIKKENNCTIL